jgi:hypothetical protein
LVPVDDLQQRTAPDGSVALEDVRILPAQDAGVDALADVTPGCQPADAGVVVFADDFDQPDRPTITNATWVLDPPNAQEARLDLADGGSPCSPLRSVRTVVPTQLDAGADGIPAGTTLRANLERTSATAARLSAWVYPESTLPGMSSTRFASMTATRSSGVGLVRVAMSLAPATSAGEVDVFVFAQLEPCPDAAPCAIQSVMRRVLAQRWHHVVATLSELGGPAYQLVGEVDGVEVRSSQMLLGGALGPFDARLRVGFDYTRFTGGPREQAFHRVDDVRLDLYSR